MKRIAQEVRKHLLNRPDESLGVVAMNLQQQELIESLLEQMAKEDPLFRERLEEDNKRKEPLFVKNLENVQGDERDVIFISLTYGPPEPGLRVPQRFGPINTELGWRRLNVLLTRARKRMLVFSSMDSKAKEASEPCAIFSFTARLESFPLGRSRGNENRKAILRSLSSKRWNERDLSACHRLAWLDTLLIRRA